MAAAMLDEEIARDIKWFSCHGVWLSDQPFRVPRSITTAISNIITGVAGVTSVVTGSFDRFY
jgi:hypothetical protein